MIAWFAENMIWASAAMLLVLAIRRPVAHLFGAGVAYALWLIPALRLVVPPADWLASLFNTPLPSLPPLVVTLDLAGGAAPPSLGGPGQWVPILLAVWAGGAIFFLGLQAWSYRRFVARLSLSMRSAGHHGGVALIESAAVDGPIALGLLDRRIVIPADFEDRYSPSERALALNHERHHHRRGDILANHIGLLILALNWFNPVAWAAFRAFRADQELSCDSAIAAAADGQARSDYARALIKSASPPGLIAACPLNGADQLKRRLKMLNHHRHDRRRLWAGSAVTAALVATSMMFGTAGHAQENQEGAGKEQRRERFVIMEMKEGEAPPSGLPREFRIRRGDNGEIIAPEGCSAGSQPIANVNEGSGNERTRILLCGKGEAMSDEKRLEALQRARTRIAERTDERGAEHKAKVLEALDREIARLRGR